MFGNGNANRAEYQSSESLGSLTGLQRAFVDAWFETNFNGVEAARRAGYKGSYSTLGSVASENLKKPKIRRAIEERWAAHGVTREEVIARLARWMRADVSALMDKHGLIDMAAVREYGDCIKELDWRKGQQLRVRLQDQMRAAELIGKTMRLFNEVVQEEHSGEMVIRFAKPDADD